MSMALAMVARARAMRRSPIPSVPALSNLHPKIRNHHSPLQELFANLRSCSERTAPLSSPGFATFRKRQRTKNVEMTSTPD